MWLYKQTVKDVVVLAFKPQYLAYAHFKKSNNKTPYSMNGYTLIPFTNLELEKQIVFNPTSIGKQLNTLLHEHKTQGTDIRISIEGPTIFEMLATQDTIVEDAYAQQLKNLVWHDMPLWNNSKYICGISREHLFQYQLLAIKHNIPITCLTTSNMALLTCHLLLTGDNKTSSLSSIKDIHSLISTQPFHTLCSHVPSTDKPLLMAELIGLCLAELTYENN